MQKEKVGEVRYPCRQINERTDIFILYRSGFQFSWEEIAEVKIFIE